RLFLFSPNYFLLSYKKKFITKFVTAVTKFVTHVIKFVIHVTKFVTKNILYERKKHQGEKKNYQQGKKNFQGERRGRLQRGCSCCAVNLQTERTNRFLKDENTFIYNGHRRALMRLPRGSRA
ncbi:MAG: hypothetical protein MR299_09155, partial [Bacteroidales bacterium]|nr:hypothetical protein [Bacteroidales bacterium]